MALCRRCAVNGDERDGGKLGVCKTHARVKCQAYGCETRTLGASLCAVHAHQEEVARWKAQANFRVQEDDEQFVLHELRREKLAQAKYLAHQAVEIYFRSMLEATTALWGDVTPEPKKVVSEEDCHENLHALP